MKASTYKLRTTHGQIFAIRQDSAIQARQQTTLRVSCALQMQSGFGHKQQHLIILIDFSILPLAP